MAPKKGSHKKKGTYGSRAKHYWHKYAPKRPSLVMMGLLGGVAMTVTGWGQSQANAFYASVQALASKAGITTKVDGTTILAVLIGLAAAASIMPNMIGKPLNNLLSRFGVRL